MLQSRQIAWFVAFVLLLSGALRPGSADASRRLFPPAVAASLDRQLATIVREHHLPSIAVGVFVPGRGRYSFANGFANLQTQLPRTIDQPFRIASVTKPFAAMAILILVDRGLLRKTDPISTWYPAFPNGNRITIDDLLRMRSGIPAPNDDAVLARVYDDPLGAVPSLTTEMAGYAAKKSEFTAPDTVGVYTDFNYDILAGIAQRITGEDIGTLITRSVIEPLKLTKTAYPTGLSIPGPLRGYGWNPLRKRFDDKTLFNPPLAGAAGAVVSNISDLLRFSRALCIGGLLKPQTQREQLVGKPLAGSQTRYGEGVATGDGVCGHSGTINGFNTDMYYLAKSNASLVISVNRLDRDNRAQTAPALALMVNTIRETLEKK